MSSPPHIRSASQRTDDVSSAVLTRLSASSTQTGQALSARSFPPKVGDSQFLPVSKKIASCSSYYIVIGFHEVFDTLRLFTPLGLLSIIKNGLRFYAQRGLRNAGTLRDL